MKKFLLLKKMKNTTTWTYIINDLNREEIVGSFYEKELEKTNQKEFRIEKLIKRKGNKLYVEWKGYNNYFPPSRRRFRGDIKVKLDLSNYATKTDLKNVTHVDVSSLASKTYLASLKTEVDKLDIPKLSIVPADLAKLTNKVANDLVEETDFNALEKKVTGNKTGQDNLETTVQNNHLRTETSINNLKTKVDSIDLTKYVKKTDYDTKVGNSELKIPDVSGLLQTSAFDSKVSELETKIKTAESKPNISKLATKTEVANVENKIHDSKAFVKKADYATEISSIKNDYNTNAALTSQLTDLKIQHIADEVKKVDLEKRSIFW